MRFVQSFLEQWDESVRLFREWEKHSHTKGEYCDGCHMDWDFDPETEYLPNPFEIAIGH